MANDLFFSRDTRVVVSDGTAYWEIPVLDGFSFSQATNTSEISLAEMSSAVSGNKSRRGRRMFNDSYAPAEWSFSTYARPFKSATGNIAGRLGRTPVCTGSRSRRSSLGRSCWQWSIY